MHKILHSWLVKVKNMDEVFLFCAERDMYAYANHLYIHDSSSTYVIKKKRRRNTRNNTENSHFYLYHFIFHFILHFHFTQPKSNELLFLIMQFAQSSCTFPFDFK